MYKLLCLLFLSYNISWGVNIDKIQSVHAITNFKPNLYMGKWYEIARIPMYFEKKCLAPITAEYKINQDGAVVNVINTCRSVADGYDTAYGKAFFTENQSIAKLKVTFLPKWLRFTGLGAADYWVLYTDYQYALVGNPNHEYLWILSRTENFDPHEITKLISIAKLEGYDVKLLKFNYVYEELMK